MYVLECPFVLREAIADYVAWVLLTESDQRASLDLMYSEQARRLKLTLSMLDRYPLIEGAKPPESQQAYYDRVCPGLAVVFFDMLKSEFGTDMHRFFTYLQDTPSPATLLDRLHRQCCEGREIQSKSRS